MRPNEPEFGNDRDTCATKLLIDCVCSCAIDVTLCGAKLLKAMTDPRLHFAYADKVCP